MATSDHSPFRAPLTLLGYWAHQGGADSWPDPADLIDDTWNSGAREDIALYLRQGIVVRAYMGRSTCRLCGEPNGNLELTDGSFIWPEGLSHYVSHHAVRLPAEFVNHVARMESLIDEVEIDATWWTSV